MGKDPAQRRGAFFSFGCERKEEKESDSASGTLGTPNKGRSMERGEGQTPFPRGAYLPRKNDASRRPFAGGLPPYGILASFGARRFPKGERKALWCARRRISPFPDERMTRRLRRELGLAVPRGAHTFLSMAKEKCAKESQRHGDSGKKASTAHFGGGARYVARSTVGQPTPTIVRARSSPSSAVKMGGPFSLRCLSPLFSPAVGGWQARPLRVGMLRCGRKGLRRG